MRDVRMVWGRILPVCLLAAGGGTSAADADVVRELTQAYDRCTSRIMVRVLESTTRAVLDAATHDRNVVFHYPLDKALTPPGNRLTRADLLFAGTLAAGSVVDRISDTPLTPAERTAALAWRPLLTYLTEWNYDAVEGLLDAAAAVSEQRWANDDPGRPLQEIAAVHLHGNELWVRLDFRPEMDAWLPVSDTDGDHYPECYAKLAPELVSAAALEQIRGDYSGRVLSLEEAQTYFHELASAWYPALMTVVLEPPQTRPWPGPDAQPAAREAMKGRVLEHAFVILRSKPFGSYLYNVFVLDADARVARGVRPRANGAGAPMDDGAPALSMPLVPVSEAVAGEVARWGGSWDAWLARVAPFHDAVRALLEARPPELHGFVGRDDFLFFRADMEFLLSGDLRRQPRGRDPFPAIVDFAGQLRKRNVDMLLVVIPTKAEVYPEMLADTAPAGGQPGVAPYGRKFLAEVAAAGVDCVDLLPVFLDHRDDGGGLLYMPQDTHWTPRGLELAAACIAQRIRPYPWYSDLADQRVTYGVRTVPCTRLGDICPMLTDAERRPFRPMQLTAHQVVTPDGALYTDDPDSPIVMLGDSFTGVFQLEDCRHAGLSAHVARETGLPVDLIMAHGSGPQIRIRLARRGARSIAAKRLVIWTVIARDLYRYRSPWTPVPLP